MLDWVPLISPPFRSCFFISYRSLEAKLAEAFENQLLLEQQDVWRDRRNIYSGDHWRSEIRTAIRDCDDVVVLLTPLAAASEQVIYEVETAIELGKRLHCLATINLRDVPRLCSVIEHINWEPVGSGSGAPSIDFPVQFASYAVGRILASLHKSHRSNFVISSDARAARSSRASPISSVDASSIATSSSATGAMPIALQPIWHGATP